MRRINRARAVFAGMLMAAMGTLGAKDLTWTGVPSTTWDKTTANWHDGSGAAVFANSDNVTVNAGTEMTLGENVAPGNVTYDIGGAFTLTLNGKSLTGVKSFEKLGTGTLTVQASNSSRGMGFYGPIDVKAGTMVLKGSNDYAAFSDLSSSKGTEYVVENGATLQVVERNSIGKVDLVGGSAASIRVKKGGTLKFGPDSSHSANSLTNLYLEGGSLVFAGNGADNIGLLSVWDTVSFSGDTPYVLEKPSVGNPYWLLSPGRPTRFDVADISGDDKSDVTLKIPFMRYDAWSGWTDKSRGFIKSGAGRLTLSNSNGDACAANGDVTVEEGVLEYTQQTQIRAMFDQAFTVKTNATLRFSMRNVVGGTGVLSPKTKFVIDHGNFLIDDPAGTAGHTYLGEELTLDHATFTTKMSGFGNGVSQLGALTFGRLVSFKGDTPYDFSPFQGMGNPFLHLGADPLTEIRVADITGNASTDVTLGYTLCDRFYDQASPQTLEPGGFIKTGTGTLQIPLCSAYRGNVEVREGTLLLDVPGYSASNFGANAKSYIGDVTVEGRTITVSTNGVLAFAQRNMTGSYTYGATGMNNIKSTLLLKGGTLKIAGSNAANAFGPITVDGGSFEYGTVSSWGPFNLRGTFRVTGDKAVTLPCATGGYSILVLYPYFATVFDVEDATGDARVDLDSWLAPSLPPDANYYNGTQKDPATGKKCPEFTYGFVKTGAGTMALNLSAGGLDFNDEARINAGAMLVNCDLSKAGPFVVASGAAVGGTGSVSALTLAEGAGFAATAGQSGALTVSGDLAIPATGTIHFNIPDGTDPEQANANVVRATGSITGLTNLSQWTLVVDGHPELTKDFHVSVINGTVCVRKNRGLSIILR